MSHELALLFTLTLTSTAAALLALGLRRPVRLLLGAATSCSMWLMVPASMVAVLLPPAHATGTPLSVLSSPVLAAAVPAAESVLGHGPLAAAGTASPGAWLAWVMGAWIAGAALLLFYFLAQQRAFVKRLGRLSGSQRVLRAHANAVCPAVMGLLRPKLILPADFTQRYTPLERRLILCHERAHLRRGDLAWNGVATLLRCLFWFNPVAHLAAACFRADQELACDAAVMLRHPGLRRTYAGAMLKTQLGVSSALVCSWNSAGILKERLRMLGRALPGPARRTWGPVCVALTCLVTGCTAWATQPPAGNTPPHENMDLRATAIDADNQNNTADVTQIVITQGGMRIQADRAHVTGITGTTGFEEAQIQDGRWTFMGNVRIDAEPRVTVRSEQAVVEVRDRRMRTATATGSPAEFEQRNAVTGELTHGHAGSILYDIDGATMRLTNDAFITDGRQTLDGPVAVYHIRQQRVAAGSGAEATMRNVHVTILPQKSSQNGSDNSGQDSSGPGPAAPSVAGDRR